MPKRKDIRTVLIIGAGPIVIGQACEFDYSGTQAVKTLREEGYRIVLINSNPATIMTDPELADATYVEPITPDALAAIIEKERGDFSEGFALLPTMGGQTALNCALSLDRRMVPDENGALTPFFEKFKVELIGASASAISKAEDRGLFREAMTKIGLETPRSCHVKTLSRAHEALAEIGLPAIIRPSFTLGGKGGGVAYNRQEFIDIVESGINASPTGEVLVEQSVLGWKEFEMEVVRDKNDNAIIVCSIENIDPMGVHTGDSMTVAPALTLSDKEYQRMRDASIAVLREIGVETGGANVQFALDPQSDRMFVIEMNPRVSRSSALASKATGFPIAKVAARLAVGYALDEILNDVTGGVVPASFEPMIDYVVTKIPRFAFEKFPGADATLTTSMKSIGETMAIGRTFAESFQKALQSLETDLTGLDEVDVAAPEADSNTLRNAVREKIATPTFDRILYVAQAMRLGFDVADIYQYCHIDMWFLTRIAEIVAIEKKIRAQGLPSDARSFTLLKSLGFSDKRLAELSEVSEALVREKRHALKVRPVYKRIDTCAAEIPSQTAYMYGAYELPFDGLESDESRPSEREKIIILGSGPNRIGQGIEFDYCCCQASFALSEAGYETIMINCNPETVSTDYDSSNRLYFEPLTEEHVLEIIDNERKNGRLKGVVVQFGGQTPLKLAASLEKNGVPILGTPPDAIDRAEDRDRFQRLIHKLGLKQPDNSLAYSLDEAREKAAILGFPFIVRPSYVLGGRAMAVIQEQESFDAYLQETLPGLTNGSGDSRERINVVLKKNPLLFDRYLSQAIEVDVDCLCDGENVVVCGVMEHIEEAGIHSGDSACSLPPHTLKPEQCLALSRQSRELARELGVIGLMNAQFALQNGEIYVLEVNPRASRTVPFVAKVIGKQIIRTASQIMAGLKLPGSEDFSGTDLKHVGVKEAVFPFLRFPSVDTVLGPEMRSTGEVIGLDYSFGAAFAKSQQASGTSLPVEGTVFVSVRDADKSGVLAPVALLASLGFTIVATPGTQKYLEKEGIASRRINKVLEGRPHIVDAVKNGDIQLIFNTTDSVQALRDSRSIRHTALTQNIPCYTTLEGAIAAAKGVEAHVKRKMKILSLQEYIA